MSTRASSSTATATATAGSTSLTTATAFASLTPADIVFFDNIIATTAPGPAEFATLKHAYQQATSSHTETESPHRWNTLLSLVQVRGRTWHERWDAVRLSLGLHPLPSSPSASSSSSLRSPSASASSTGAHSETRRHDASPSRVHFTPTARQRTLDTLTARAGSLALAAASSASAGGARTPRQTQKQPQSQEQDTDDDLFAQDSDDDDDDYEYQPPTRPRQPTTPASASTTARTRTPATARSTSGKAVLADLIRAVKSISIDNQNQASNNNSATPAPSRKRPSLRSSHAELSRDDGDQDADADDSLILPPARAARIERNKHLATNPPPHPHLSAHIASVVQRARAEREALRHQHSPMDNEVLAGAKEKEIEENAAADEYARRVLLIKSLAWWLTQTRRSFARQTHVSNMHKNLLLRRVLSHWITLSHTRRAEEERAARIDQVRVIVTAWNGWMEKVRGRWSTKKEERREAIRTAFKGVVHLRGKNALTLALKTWKEKYDSRLADAVRREHLQRGALALWTLAASKMASLHAIEDRIVQRREKGRKRELWVLWKVRVREAEWERRERGRRKRALWEWWKKAAMLNNMASILERHRLLQSSLSSWLRAHTHHVHLAHSHAVFTRRSLRSLKKRTLAQWATALDALREKEEEALRFRVGSDLAHLRRCMALWMGREREMLFRRVSEGRSVSSAWGYWRKTLVEREGRYELQESILTERVRLGTLKTGWTALVSAFTLQNALGTAADALARKVSVERAFAKWRAVGRRREAEWAEAEERDTKVLVEGAWSTWVERRRGKVLERMERGRQEGLMRSAFAAWKAQTTQKQSLRLAEIRARTHDAALTQRHFLHRWTSRIIKVRNEYYDAGVRADGKLKRAAWVRWKDVLVAHGEMVGLVECFREVKAQEQLARTFDTWFDRTYASLDQKARFEEIVQRREGRIVRTAWEGWVDRRVDAQLRGVEYEAVLVRKTAVLSRAFGRWKARTLTLPIISSTLTNIKQSSLHRWRLALPLAQSRRLATEFERRHLLPRFWAAWVGAAKVERNLRAAERFGGVGMRKFKSVSGRVRIGGVGVAVGVVVSPPGVGVGTSGAAAGGGAHHQGGGQGGARVGSPFSTASRRRRWSLGPPVPDEDDDDDDE